MSFPIPSLDQLHQMLLASYGNAIDGSDLSRSSDSWKRLRTTALGATSLHAHIATVFRDLLPDTCAPDLLPRWGKILRLPALPATPATKANALRVVGTAGSTVSLGDQLTATDGTRYQANETASIPGGGTYIDVDILAIDTGSATRKPKGEILTFSAPAAGINAAAELQFDLDEGGADAEAPPAYRARILDRIAVQGMGGNQEDYREWVLQVAGVATAYVYPRRQGIGSVDVTFLHAGSGASRCPTTPEIAVVQTYVDNLRPVSVADFHVLGVTSEPTTVELAVEPIDAAHDFDWDDTLPPTVTGFVAATRVLTLDARPGDMVLRDRLSYKGALNDGAELVVEALGPGGNDVTVAKLTENQAANPPVAGNVVYSGGALVAPVRAYVQAIFDGLGPGRGGDRTKVAGQWEDTLRTSALLGAQKLDGVLDVTPVAPVGNVAGSNVPPLSTVGLLVAQQILVRRA
jgi:uncharacterized phage protein gp47/JayE